MREKVSNVVFRSDWFYNNNYNNESEYLISGRLQQRRRDDVWLAFLSPRWIRKGTQSNPNHVEDASSHPLIYIVKYRFQSEIEEGAITTDGGIA